jgi:hypothetical protein
LTQKSVFKEEQGRAREKQRKSQGETKRSRMLKEYL